MLTCAFPDGLDRQGYIGLLAVLNEEMSHRSIATVISLVFEADYFEVLNEVYGLSTNPEASPAAVAQTKARLMPCGYQAWLAEP
jgi:hypothetical protein